MPSARGPGGRLAHASTAQFLSGDTLELLLKVVRLNFYLHRPSTWGQWLAAVPLLAESVTLSS